LISCSSANVAPGRWAPSTWACNTHRRSDSTPTPNLQADQHAGGIHRSILIQMIEHHLHRTLTLLDRVGHNRHPSHRRKRLNPERFTPQDSFHITQQPLAGVIIEVLTGARETTSRPTHPAHIQDGQRL
jgi:hypothetical protein